MNNLRLWEIAQRFGTKSLFKKSLLIWLMVLVFGNFGATIFALSNDGNGILDFAGYPNILAIKKLWLTSSESYALLNGYSETGRQVYYYILGIDFLVPITGALFFICAFSNFYLNQSISISFYTLLCILPPLFIIADYLENIFILLMLYRLPDTYPLYSQLVTLGLTLKFTISTLSCTIIIILFLVRYARHKFKQHRPRH